MYNALEYEIQPAPTQHRLSMVAHQAEFIGRLKEGKRKVKVAVQSYNPHMPIVSLSSVIELNFGTERLIMETILAAAGVGIAAGSFGVGAATYREARKARQAQNGDLDGGSNSSRGPTTSLWQKGGTEQLFIGGDGSVAAIGRGPGDFSMGFVQTGKHTKQSKKAAVQTTM